MLTAVECERDCRVSHDKSQQLQQEQQTSLTSHSSRQLSDSSATSSPSSAASILPLHSNSFTSQTDNNSLTKAHLTTTTDLKK